jgi:type IV secretory pathway VirB3-like protein
MSESEKTPSDPLFQAMTRPPLVWPGIASDWALYTILAAVSGLFLAGRYAGSPVLGFVGCGLPMLAAGLVIQRVDPHLVQIWDVLLLRCARPCRVSRHARFRVYGE